MQLLRYFWMCALLSVCSGCPGTVYERGLQRAVGTPTGDGWQRVTVPDGPPLSVEIPDGSVYKVSYSELDTGADDSVKRDQHPSYMIRVLKILDGSPLPALYVTFLWIEPEMRLLTREDLERLDQSVGSPDVVSRIFLEKLWYSRRETKEILERHRGPQDEPSFVDFGFRHIGGRPGRCFAFVPRPPAERPFWYEEICLVAVDSSRALVIEGTFHPEGQTREKGTVWPRVLDSIRFSRAVP